MSNTPPTEPDDKSTNTINNSEATTQETGEDNTTSSVTQESANDQQPSDETQTRTAKTEKEEEEPSEDKIQQPIPQSSSTVGIANELRKTPSQIFATDTESIASTSVSRSVRHSTPQILARPDLARPHTSTQDSVQGQFVGGVAINEPENGKGKIKETTVPAQDGSTRDILYAQLAKGVRSKSPASGGSRHESRSHSAPNLSPSEIIHEIESRRYWILTAAGKPVYTSENADEEEVSGYVGVMQAIISIFADDNDRIRLIKAGQSQIAFYLKSPVYLVAASDYGEPESVLRSHLEYLYLQLLSIITKTQLQRIFSVRTNFDLRRLLEGSEKFFNGLISTLQTDFSLPMGCLEVCRLDSFVREECSQALSASTKEKNLLYAMVIAGEKLVVLLRPKRHSVYPSDVHLIINTVKSTSTLSSPMSEHWIPICLPKYNSTGFLHAYVAYISKRVGIILVGPDREGFSQMREVKEKMAEKMHSTPLLGQLEDAAREHAYQAMHVSGAPGVRHFVYKSKANLQVTSPSWEGEYDDESKRKQLITMYQRSHDMLHRKPPVKVVYMRSEQDTVLAWSTSKFELYLAVSPILPKATAIKSAHAVAKWVKSQEKEVFLLGAPTL